MKKLIALILAALMLCGVLAACSSAPSDPEDVCGSVTPITQSTEPEETEAPTEEATEPEETESDSSVSFGAVSGNLYTNTYAGFQMELDENWTLLTAEELQELPENINALFEDAEIGDTMKNYTQFFDMQATNMLDMSSVNVVYQVKDASMMLAGKLMSEEDILDATLEQKDTMISSYAAVGIEVESIEKVSMEFLGKTHFAMKTSAKVMEMDYCMLQLFDYSIGDYGVIITIAAFGEEALDSVLDLFQPLN